MIDKTKNILIIVESPTKANHIQEFVKKNGYTKTTVMASIGHIMALADGGNYYNSGVDPTNNFELNLVVSEDKKEIVKKLKLYADNADYILLMSDGDREGYVIAWSLIKFLKLPKDKCFRIVTHEITEKAVIKAIENPVPMDQNLVDAGLTRMTIDKMIGYRLSPVAKTYIGAKSVGRCQSVGLYIVAEREKEIRSFIPETYYDLYVNFEKNNTKFKAKYIGNAKVGTVDHIKNIADLTTIKNNCNKQFIIDSIVQKNKEESPKMPFCTSTFQQEASSKLNIKVKDLMSIAQYLFERGLITYHRTVDTEMSDTFVKELQEYVEKGLNNQFINPNIRFKKLNQTKTTKQAAENENIENNGHECLRITDPNTTPEKYAQIDPNNLHQKVYKLIWQRTIAATLPNAIISETKYTIDNNGEKFIMTSNELIKEGFKEIYNYKDDSKDEDKDQNILIKETFSKDEILQKCKLEEATKETKPRPRYTEATLIKKLETSEVGRPSTYNTIVDTVLSPSRGYAELKDKTIVPTELGMQLAGYLDRNFNNIINLTYTKEMEEDLDKIAAGKLTKLEVLNAFYTDLENTISNNVEGKTKETDQVCPLCGAPMVVRRNKWGSIFLGCSKFPSCRGIINIK